MKDTPYDMLRHTLDSGLFVDQYRKRVKDRGLDKAYLTLLHMFKNNATNCKVWTTSQPFVEHTYDVSIEHIDKMPWFLASAKPSFPRMFINDDTKHRVATANKRTDTIVQGLGANNPDEVTPTGYLVVDRDGWVTIQPVGCVPLGLKPGTDKFGFNVLPEPFLYAYAYQGTLTEETIQQSHDMLSIMFGTSQQDWLGETSPYDLSLKLMFGFRTDDTWRNSIELLRGKVALIPSPFGSMQMEMATRNGQQTMLEYRERWQHMFMEVIGDVRYLITALAIMNDVPLRVEEREKGSRGRLKTTGRSSVKVADTVIYLNLLKRYRTRKAASDAIGKALVHANKRRHPVRGHWMYFGRDEACVGEQHCAWPREYADHQTCDKCGCKRTFRKAHERGHIELGYVNKEYRV